MNAISQLKKNVFSRSFISFVELAFSLFSFPYIASKLGPESIGRLDFVNATASYFVSISAFGVGEFGLREIAQNKANPLLLKSSLSDLFQFKFVSCLITFLVYIFVIIPFVGNWNLLFILSSLLLLSSLFNMVWALEGLEEFSFLAKARFVSRLLFLGFILFFIKNEKHLNLYFIGMIFFDFFYFLCAFLKLKMSYGMKVLSKKLFKTPSFSRFKEVSAVYLLTLLQALIAGTPSFLMGKSEKFNDLGQLSVAMRFFWIGFYAIIPLSTVLLSRSMSHKLGSFERSKHLRISLISLITLAVPISVGLFSVSGDVITLFVGQDYFEAIQLLKILTPLIVILSLNQFWGMQVIFSEKQDRFLLKAYGYSSLVMIFSSFYLIDNYSSLGAAISLMSTKIIILVALYIYGRKLFFTEGLFKTTLKVGMASVVMFLMTQLVIVQGFVDLAYKISLGIITYLVILFFMKHPLLSKG